MRVFTYSALRHTYDSSAPPTNVATVSPATVSVTVADDVTELDLAVFDFDPASDSDSDFGNAEVITEIEELRIDGAVFDIDAIEFFAIEATLDDGRRTEFVTLYDFGPDVEYYIELSGDVFTYTTAAEANEIFASAVSAGELRDDTIVLDEVRALQSVEDIDDPAGPEEPEEPDAPGISETGTDGDDTLVGTPDADTLDGGAGNDRIEGLASGDDLRGGTGDDGILGADGDDLISGGDGDDNVAAAEGSDTVNGGPGSDFIGGGPGGDELNGGSGNDTIGGGQGADRIDAGDGDNVVAGGPDDDVITLGSGNDVAGASFGNDVLSGGAGNDDLGGGTGRDTIDAGTGNDSVGGGEGDDSIQGGAGDDFLAGGGRDDIVFGDAGNDTINAGDGSDRIFGGAGADVFVWNAPDIGAADRIEDFETGVDTIRLSGVAGAGADGKFAALQITDAEGALLPSPTAVISYGQQEIQLIGVSSVELDADDFLFL